MSLSNRVFIVEGKFSHELFLNFVRESENACQPWHGEALSKHTREIIFQLTFSLFPSQFFFTSFFFFFCFPGILIYQ